MPTFMEPTVDVTEAAGLSMAAHQAVTVHLPEAGALADPPMVCFAFPGAGYSRQYYSFDMPDSGRRVRVTGRRTSEEYRRLAGEGQLGFVIEGDHPLGSRPADCMR